MNEANVSADGFWIAAAIMLVAFYGEPDLVDAVIYYLTEQQDGWNDNPDAITKEKGDQQ